MEDDESHLLPRGRMRTRQCGLLPVVTWGNIVQIRVASGSLIPWVVSGVPLCNTNNLNWHSRGGALVCD